MAAAGVGGVVRECPPCAGMGNERGSVLTVLTVHEVAASYRTGTPITFLVDEPARQKAAEAAEDNDLLVVGSRGGGLARLILGSISSQVVHHAQCPVVVVPENV